MLHPKLMLRLSHALPNFSSIQILLHSTFTPQCFHLSFRVNVCDKLNSDIFQPRFYLHIEVTQTGFTRAGFRVILMRVMFMRICSTPSPQIASCTFTNLTPCKCAYLGEEEGCARADTLGRLEPCRRHELGEIPSHSNGQREQP